MDDKFSEIADKQSEANQSLELEEDLAALSRKSRLIDLKDFIKEVKEKEMLLIKEEQKKKETMSISQRVLLLV